MTTSSSRRERAPVPGQDAVGEAGGLDEARLELDLVARAPLGLVDGDRAQHEEPADEHDRDGEQAAGDEAHDG